MQSLSLEPATNHSDGGRFRGNRGGIIPMHRALARLNFGPVEMLVSVTTAVGAIVGWVLSLPSICEFWKLLFTLGLRFLPLQGALKTSLTRFSFGLTMSLPYFEFDPQMPTPHLWAATCLVVLAMFGVTFLLPPKLLPIVYLLRCVLFVQGSALVYFALFPAQFSYAPSDYLKGFLLSGAGLIGIVPVLFLLTYYIFPFSLVQKTFLTLSTMAYLTVFLPFQLLLHALLLGKSILFMPTLYLVAGMPLDVLIIVALYAWGMTWEFNDSRTTERTSTTPRR
ncbi:MAG TPA: hypothetical protein VJO35_02750 [Terriglobales bacterium]|nr:hypothetical protein [Terriglobales bacterium]